MQPKNLYMMTLTSLLSQLSTYNFKFKVETKTADYTVAVL